MCPPNTVNFVSNKFSNMAIINQHNLMSTSNVYVKKFVF